MKDLNANARLQLERRQQAQRPQQQQQQQPQKPKPQPQPSAVGKQDDQRIRELQDQVLRLQQQLKRSEASQQPNDKGRKGSKPNETQALKALLEQCKSDNDQLLQKLKVLSQKKRAVEEELLEARAELSKKPSNGGVSLPKINGASRQRLTEEQEAALLQEVRLLRIENEELQRILGANDQARVVKELTIQNARLRSKIDDLQQKAK